LEGIGEGIGMDCSVVPLRQKDLFMVTTTDYFYPLVDDPYMQGMIGCANVLADQYAMGVSECDTMLMILAVSLEMEKSDREIATRLMIEGFNDQAKKAGTNVTGGQTVQNPWPIIGGVATSIVSKSEFITPDAAEPGDVIVLTKPLGIQVAVNLSQWRYTEAKWIRVADITTKEEVEIAYQKAISSMARLNRNGAKLMHKYGAHGATDVTGFGILGHGRNLAKNQKKAVDFQIHSLPIIKGMAEADTKVNIFSLLKGQSAETSGGLFICLAADQAEKFCKEIQEIDGEPAWIIGKVVERTDLNRSNDCFISPDVKVIPY